MEATIEQAKELINLYYEMEFEDKKEVDFSDLSNIEIACTDFFDEETGKEYVVQVAVDLINFSLITYIDGNSIIEKNYESLDALITSELEWLNFEALVSLPEEIIDKIHDNETDNEAIKELDRYEAEYGADGIRALKNSINCLIVK